MNETTSLVESKSFLARYHSYLQYAISSSYTQISPYYSSPSSLSSRSRNPPLHFRRPSTNRRIHSHVRFRRFFCSMFLEVEGCSPRTNPRSAIHQHFCRTKGSFFVVGQGYILSPETVPSHIGVLGEREIRSASGHRNLRDGRAPSCL